MFRATHTPPLSYMLDDLLTRDQKAIAKHLGVSVKTLKRWTDTDNAPRAVLLALFYETRWGKSLIDADLHNGALWARGQPRGRTPAARTRKRTSADE